MSLTSFLRGLVELKYLSPAISPFITHFSIVIILRTIYPWNVLPFVDLQAPCLSSGEPGAGLGPLQS